MAGFVEESRTHDAHVERELKSRHAKPGPFESLATMVQPQSGRVQ